MKTLSLLLTLAAVLAGQAKKEKRSAGAHEHGAAKLDIAMEGRKGKLVWEVPLESLTGFEYEPKSAADKGKLATAQATIRASLKDMVVLPAAAGCAIQVGELELERHGNHAEMHTHASIECRQAPAGEVSFAFGKYFPGIHKTAVQYVSEAVQTGASIEHDRGELRIGR